MTNYLWVQIVEGRKPVQVFCLPPYCGAGGRDSCRVSGNKISDDLVHKTPSADLLIILDGHESPLFWGVLLSHHIPGWGRREDSQPMNQGREAVERQSQSRTWTSHFQGVLLKHTMWKPQIVFETQWLHFSSWGRPEQGCCLTRNYHLRSLLDELKGQVRATSIIVRLQHLLSVELVLVSELFTS